jgi:glycosyltransferase involved in cell wall biosynthesis
VRALAVARPLGVNASIVGFHPTGLGIYALKLARALDAVREDLVVFSSWPEAFAPLRGRTCRAPAAVRPERGLRGHLARFVWLQSAFRAQAHAWGLGTALNMVPEGFLAGSVPQVTIVHDLLPVFFPEEYPRQQYYFRYLVPRVLAASRLVVAVSENTRRDIVRVYGIDPARVQVVHSGCDADVFQPPPAPAAGPPYFLYVGNLLPHKNVLRLLDAFALLCRRRPARLVIRGDARRGHGRHVLARVEALGLGHAVSVVPYASEAQMRRLYGGAIGLVMPSLYEGFGLPVLEAMACGTPVITSGTSAMPEVAGDAALLVDPQDSVGLAEAMHALATDADLREDLRVRGRRRAAVFTWERTATELSRLLDEAGTPSPARQTVAP